MSDLSRQRDKCPYKFHPNPEAARGNAEYMEFVSVLSFEVSAH